jgi:GNAT superfamily N-acetyltransferase
MIIVEGRMSRILQEMSNETPPAEIRRTLPGHAAVLTRLAHASKAHWGYPAAWLRHWSPQLTFTADYIRDRPVYALFEGEVVLACHAVAVPADAAELEHFWVSPDAMGRGLGRRLFEHAVATARAGGAVCLEIDSDPHALGFYLNMGAREIGRTPAPMEGDPERYLPRLSFPLDEA